MNGIIARSLYLGRFAPSETSLAWAPK